MVSNGQRALWTFLIYALAGPFFAALALVIVIALASVFGLSGLLPVEVEGMGQAGLVAFVWSAVPALITALIVGAVVWRTGGLSWMVAAAVAVIAFAATAMLLPLDLHGRTVVLVDDGLATGATMVAAIRAARKAGAERVVVAAPVASVESAALVAAEADEVAIVCTPPLLFAIGDWYRDFAQVDDAEVRRLLARAHASVAGPAGGAGG